MAHKKGQGSSRNGRDSNAQRRGVKLFGGQHAKAGAIIVRQVGTRFHAGDGTVHFETRKRNGRTFKRVRVDPLQTT